MKELQLWFKHVITMHGRNCLLDLTCDFEGIAEKLLQIEGEIKYCYEQGFLKLVADNFEIRTDDLENIIYEFNLKKIENDEISITVDFYFMCEIYDEVKSLLGYWNAIDLKQYVQICKSKSKANSENMIFEKRSENKDGNYILAIKMFLEGNILKIKKTCVSLVNNCDKYCVTEKEAETDILTGKSRLDQVIINDFLTLKLLERNLLQTIHQLERYHMEYKIQMTIVNVPGHYIEEPCMKICAKDFSLIYYHGILIQVHFNSEILENSYFRTNMGIKHRLSEIIEKEVKETDKYVDVEGYGADDAWHCAGINNDGKYFYILGKHLK